VLQDGKTVENLSEILCNVPDKIAAISTRIRSKILFFAAAFCAFF
jgi:hypothetical protein